MRTPRPWLATLPVSVYLSALHRWMLEVPGSVCIGGPMSRKLLHPHGVTLGPATSTCEQAIFRDVPSEALRVDQD